MVGHKNLCLNINPVYLQVNKNPFSPITAHILGYKNKDKAYPTKFHEDRGGKYMTPPLL
jgi:hypothetical protein